ncbi:MAG: hypothetical protein WB714_12030 [Candidatus Sulfotelmatobacter sp.]
MTAFATADHTKNVNTAVTVSSYASALSGTYVFQVLGNNGTDYQIMGALVLDGKGNVTAGQETVNNLLGTTTPPFSTAYTLEPSSTAPSTYFIGPDGRGIITANLQPTNASSPVTPFTETFSLVVISNSEALIAENDENCAFNCPTIFGATGFGTLELQDAAAASTMPSGAYAFVTNGTDSGNSSNPLFGLPAPTAIGGIFNIDNNPSTGDISGNGSLADQDYYSQGLPKLIRCVPPTGLTGNVTRPSSMGVVTITLTGQTCFGTTTPATIQFAGYIVDSQNIRLIEIDDVSGSSGFLTSGIAVSQGTAAGTFTQASLSGAYVFGILGSDGAVSGENPATLTSVGTVTADGHGKLNGEIDSFYGIEGASFTCPLPQANTGNSSTACPPGTSGMYISGTYALDSDGSGGAGLGRANVSFKFSETGPNGFPPEPTIVFYLSGNGTPPLVMYAGDSDPNYPAVGAGIGYPQPSAALLTFGNPETYGINFTQFNGSSENDGSGVITAQQNPQPPPQWEFTGTVDDTGANDFYSGGPPFFFSILDSFTPPADRFGRINGTFMNVPGSGTNGPFYAYYLVDDNHGFFVETDLATSAQTSLGYFAQACDVTSTTSCQQGAAASKRAARARSLRSLRKLR